jgi:hypothetical protein
VINLINSNVTADFPRRPIEPCHPSYAHPLIQSDASGEVDKVEQLVRVRRLLGHFLVGFPVIDSRSAQRKD